MQYLLSYSHKNLRHDVMSANIENNRGLFKSQVDKIKHFLLQYKKYIYDEITRSHSLIYLILGNDDLYQDRNLDEGKGLC